MGCTSKEKVGKLNFKEVNSHFTEEKPKYLLIIYESPQLLKDDLQISTFT